MIRPNKLLKKYDIKEFFKRHWWLALILFSVLIIPTVIYFIVFNDFISDASIWASFVSAIIAYIGTSILSIFVYYFTWKQNVIDYNSNLPAFEISYNPEYKEEYFRLTDYNDLDKFTGAFYERCSTGEDKYNYNYYHIIFKNLTKNGVRSIKPLYYLYIEKENNQYKYIKINKFMGFSDDLENIEYSDLVNICFGVSKEHIIKLGEEHNNQVFRFAFEILDYENRKYCIIVDCILGKTLGVSERFVYNSKYLDASAAFPENVTRYYLQFV